MNAWSRLSLALSFGLSALVSCSGKHHSSADDEDSDGGAPFDAAIYQPDGYTSSCFGSTFRCEGETAIPCEPGTGVKPIDCAEKDMFCNPVHGCSSCIPGTTSCADGKATWCRQDGTLAQFECDSMQGLSCQPSGCRGPCALNEVQDSYIGCDYYPTVTLNPVWQGFSFAIAVSNTAHEPTHVTVTQGERMIKQITVAGDALETIELPWVSELKGGDVACTDPPAPGATRIAKDGAYRVRTDRPVTVYQFSPLEYQLGKTKAEIPAGCQVIDPTKGNCVPHDQLPDNARCLSYSNDASLLLPANALTNSYTALAWPSQTEQGRSTGSSFVAVTATEDGTVLEVRSAQEIEPGAGLSKSGTGKVMLDRGDVLELVAGADKDLSGTRLRSDKPVQVIAGQSCAYVPDSTTGTCDHLEEAMLPEDTLGASYVVTMPVLLTFPQDLTPTPFVMRLSAILDGTTINFEPLVHAPITLDAGEIRDVSLSGDEIKNVLAKANRPFQVATFMVGQEALPGGSILGDPSMSLGIPVEQYRTNYLFTAPTTYDLNFATVIAKQGTNVRIDGMLLAASDFSAVGKSDYRVAQVLLDDAKAVHTLTASDEVGLTVYGYGWYTSYMYPGGADLERIFEPPIL
jgi:IgGFc binding protein